MLLFKHVKQLDVGFLFNVLLLRLKDQLSIDFISRFYFRT